MDKKTPTCAIIIVTHNSQKYLAKCLTSLKQQTFYSKKIIIVDSGSSQTDYLDAHQQEPNVHVHFTTENVGFCQGNNIGMTFLPPHTDYVLFLNPDAFLTPSFLEQAIHYMELNSSSRIGALSGLLLGYDIKQDQPTGKLDSTGIFQQWYGRWYDRGQGQPYYTEQYQKQEEVPALCGALMFCRKKALDEVMLSPGEVMDSSFYMYKEDIDLSLRLRRKQWALVFLPQLIAYHCRGWQKDRFHVPRHLRLLSAKNEIRLHARLYSPYLFYSVFKYMLIKTFDV